MEQSTQHKRLQETPSHWAISGCWSCQVTVNTTLQLFWKLQKAQLIMSTILLAIFPTHFLDMVEVLMSAILQVVYSVVSCL